MAKDGASITIDSSEFIRRMDLADARVRMGSWDAMNENRLDLENEAKNLCPVSPNGGTLLRSGNSNQPTWKGNELSASVGFNTEYAALVHETVAPAIATPQKRPGPTTQNKPATRFGEAGGKYLERPLLGKARDYTAHIAKTVKKRLR